MNDVPNFFKKYVKYKTKYLMLRQYGGGKNNNKADYVKGVQEPWFTHIKEGRKTVEGRLDKGDFSKMKVGETIEWRNKGDKFRVKIIGINKYETFREYLETEGLENCLPNVDMVEDGIAVYRKFYSDEKEKQYGVLAIKVKVID